MGNGKIAYRDKLFIKALRGRQEVYNLTGKYSTGMKDCERALSFCRRRIPSRSIEYQLMIDLGGTLQWNNDHKGAKEIIMKALKSINKNKEKNAYARCLNVLGTIHFGIGEYEKTLQYYRESIKLAEEMKNKEGIASGSNNIGLYYWSTGKLEKALQYFKMAHKLWERIGNRVGIGVASGNIGLVHFSLGDLNKALGYFLRNLEVSEEINHKIRIVIALGNVGEVYKEKGDIERALDFYQKALVLSTQLGIINEIAFANLYLGTAYAEKGDLGEAKKCLEKAKRTFLKWNDSINLSSVYVSLARTHREGKDHKLSMECARKALSLTMQTGAKEQEIGALREMGKTVSKSNPEKALSYLEKSISIAKDEVMKLELAKSSFELAKILKASGKSKDAEKHMNKAKSIFKKAGAQGWLQKTVY